MKVTEVPLQIEVDVAAMLIAGATLVTTVIVKALELTVVGLAHAALEVSTRLMISPLFRPAELKEAAVAPPILTPLSCH